MLDGSSHGITFTLGPFTVLSKSPSIEMTFNCISFGAEPRRPRTLGCMSEPPPLIASNCGHDHGNGRDSTRVLDPDTRIPSFDDLSHVVSLQHSTDSFWENGYDRLETEASEIDVRLFPQIQFVSYKCTMGSLFLGFFPFLPPTSRVPMSELHFFQFQQRTYFLTTTSTYQVLLATCTQRVQV